MEPLLTWTNGVQIANGSPTAMQAEGLLLQFNRADSSYHFSLWPQMHHYKRPKKGK